MKLKVPDEALCYPPHQDDNWRLNDQATNNWLGVVEDRTGEEILNLADWASQDFAKAFAFAQRIVRDYILSRFGITLGDYF